MARRAALLALALLASCGKDEPEPRAWSAHDEQIARFQSQQGRLEARGRWRELPGLGADSELSEEERAALRELEAVGYAAGVRDARALTGVTRHDPERAHAGLNLYTSGHAAQALLVDMQGRVLHRWSKDFLDVWPDFPPEQSIPGLQYWRRAHLSENGDLLAIHEGLALVKLDRDSQVLWALDNRAHHDLEVQPDGRIFVLTREPHVVERIHPRLPVLEDYVVVLGPDGEERRRVSVLECVERSELEIDLRARVEHNQDIFHTNSLEVLDGSLASRVSAFRRGNVLVSLRHLDLLAVLDLRERRVVWAAQGEWRAQHDPTVLPSGRLLLFDNEGVFRLGGEEHASTVLELDPLDLSVGWRYRGSELEPFYSETCGTAQRLPGGTTLITESDAGRAFEVTREGEVVWEYWNPHRAGPGGRYIATLFEMVRLPADFPVDWARGE